MSPELETLDQLLGGDMPLAIIRRVYPSDDAFVVGVHALLCNGDVRLLSDGVEVPQWRWRELFVDVGAACEILQLELTVTEQGARRVS